MKTIDTQHTDITHGDPSPTQRTQPPLPYLERMGDQQEKPPEVKLSFSTLEEKIERNQRLASGMEYAIYGFGGMLLGQVARAFSAYSLLFLLVPVCIFLNRDVFLALLAQWSEQRWLTRNDIARMLISIGYIPSILFISALLGALFF